MECQICMLRTQLENVLMPKMMPFRREFQGFDIYIYILIHFSLSWVNHGWLPILVICEVMASSALLFYDDWNWIFDWWIWFMVELIWPWNSYCWICRWILYLAKHICVCVSFSNLVYNKLDLNIFLWITVLRFVYMILILC